MFQGVQDLSRCLSSGNRKYFGKWRQVFLRLLVERNFPLLEFLCISPTADAPPPSPAPTNQQPSNGRSLDIPLEPECYRGQPFYFLGGGWGRGVVWVTWCRHNFFFNIFIHHNFLLGYVLKWYFFLPPTLCMIFVSGVKKVGFPLWI